MKRFSNFSPFLAIIHNCLASLFAMAIMATFFGFLAKIEETQSDLTEIRKEEAPPPLPEGRGLRA